jgi:preprotein translocase subunit SecD
MGGAAREHRLTARALAGVVCVGTALFALLATGCDDGERPVLTDQEGGTTAVLEPDRIPEDGELDYAARVIDDRIGVAGFPDATISVEDGTLVVRSKARIAEELLERIGGRGQLEFRPVSLTYPDGASDGRSCEELELVPAAETSDECYELGPSVLDGAGITEAAARYDDGASGWVVDITFSGSEFGDRVAEPYVNEQVAIVVDDAVVTAPVINPGVLGNSVQISGDFGEGEAEALAATLQVAELLPMSFHATDVEGAARSGDGRPTGTTS